MQKIKRDDEVIVIAGKDKGKRGTVKRVLENRFVVSGVNMIKRHTKPNPMAGNQGGIVEQGTKAEILAPPYAPYTELLLSSVPEMDPDWLDDLVDRRKRGEAPTAESIAS